MPGEECRLLGLRQPFVARGAQAEDGEFVLEELQSVVAHDVVPAGVQAVADRRDEALRGVDGPCGAPAAAAMARVVACSSPLADMTSVAAETNCSRRASALIRDSGLPLPRRQTARGDPIDCPAPDALHLVN